MVSADWKHVKILAVPIYLGQWPIIGWADAYGPDFRGPKISVLTEVT